MKTRHPECKSDKDLKEMDMKEKALAMLILHNQKVDKIQAGWRNDMERKKRAKE